MKLVYNPERDLICTEEDLAYRLIYLIDQYSPAAKDILDVGMGKGYLVKVLKDSGKNAFGIDLRNLNPEGLLIADANHIPFKDESFDVVTDCYSLADMHDFQDYEPEDIGKVIKEIKRILRPYGLFMSLATSRGIRSSFSTKQLYEDGYWGFYQK